ncbi:hypothetical protein SNE40_014499 [Patella caerulea]|uniref:Sushi domain-containing protein n=1 Tax=Patella caerulea TaxID=87958 RepID=A0AAN8JEH2_PATCE
MACTSLPVINNGYITAQDGTSRVEYECLAGFELIGDKVIDCDATAGWARAPSCQSIKNSVTFTDQSNDQYTFAPDWWYAFLAVMLCILVILCITGFIWCCICKMSGGATIYPMRSNCGERSISNVENGTENNEKVIGNPDERTTEQF